MAIELNRMIVPAHDKEESAKFFARVFALSYDSEVTHFALVRVNASLTLDSDNRLELKSH